MSAQIAVGDDADQRLAVHDTHTAEAFARHLRKNVHHGSIGMKQRHGIPGMHEIPHERKFLPQRSPRMKTTEILLSETARRQKTHGKSISERHLHRGACGGSTIQRARLMQLRLQQKIVAMLAQKAVCISGYGNKRHIVL